MRKFIMTIGLFALGGISQVQAGSGQLFDCVDSATLNVNSNCVANKFEQNDMFVKMQSQFYEQQSMKSGNAIATLIFDEKKMQIDVIAHQDAVDLENLYVVNDNF